MDGSTSSVGRGAAAIAAVALASLIPLAVLAPRGMPVWTIVLTLAAGALLLCRDGFAALRPGCGFAVGAGFVGFAALSALWSPSSRAGLTALEIGYVAFGAWTVGRWISGLRSAEAARLGRLFLAGLAVGAVLLAINILFKYPLVRWWNVVPDELNLAATNVPKRTAALLALLVWPAAALTSSLWAGRWARRAELAVPLAYAAASIATGSRSAQAGMAAGLAVWCLGRVSAGTTRRALVAALVAAFVVAPPLASHLGDGSWLFDSAQHRLEIWARTSARVPDAPLFGHGVDASRALQPRPGETSRFETLTSSLLPLHPHNAFLQLWLELGAVGGALAVAAAVGVLGIVRRLPGGFHPPALALFATGLVMANTAYGLWQAWWMSGYLASGLMMALAVRAAAVREPPPVA